MLSPDSRTLIFDALRPPEEFQLDQAILTTYSLDLTAALVAPLAFARLDGYGSSPVPGEATAESSDPFALLKSLRGYAERMTVFAQAGQIHVPRAYQRLYTYLEGSIVSVTPDSELGVFHPKVWVLRFTHDDGSVKYRLLCLSRNLTFDSSWDTALILDGDLRQDRTRAFADNHPLGEFVESLPGLAVQPVGAATKKRLDLMAEELRRVDFELPADFDELSFAPIGIDGHRGMPFSDTDRADARLIISPFVSDAALRDLPGRGGTLVSRLDELERLHPETIESFDEVMVLCDAAEHPDGAPELETLSSPSEWRPPPVGLHAKLYVFDEGWSARVWSGSANATNAAFRENVEFLVPMRGKKSAVGVAATLAALRPLLEPYRGKGRDGGATEEEQLEALVRRARAALARTAWTAKVSMLEDARYSLELRSDEPVLLPDGATLSARPLTLPRSWARAVDGVAVQFAGCSYEALTSFFVFELHARLGTTECLDEFVVNAQLLGAPDHRLARVLEDLLSSPAKVMRFLQLLLADTPADILEAIEAGRGEAEAGPGAASHADERPLLESMLRALAREPAKLQAIGQVVEDLEKTNGLARLPPGFLEVWAPIQAARVAMGERK